MLHYKEAELNEIAKKISMELWGMEVNLPIRYNGRLKTTLGRVGMNDNGKPIFIELQTFAEYNKELLIDTLKHELCHWYCFVTGKKYHDGDEDFENELKRIGAHSTGTVNTTTRCHAFGCFNSQCENNKKRMMFYTRTNRAFHKYKNKKCTECGEKLDYMGIRYERGDTFLLRGESNHLEEIKRNTYRQMRSDRTKLKKNIKKA